MKIIFLTHQENFLGYSMKRYTQFLSDGMQQRGHKTTIWGPKLYLSKNRPARGIGKWLRYIDQFLLFPIWFKYKSKDEPQTTLFVLIDQALGIWTPLINKKAHVLHCHDFIALNSALGKIKENPTSWSGKMYQQLIYKGFSKANNFISVSKNTQNELTNLLSKPPRINEQVYNAIDPSFKPGSKTKARTFISNRLSIDVSQGYILHVGGNTFYKNREGVLGIYEALRNQSTQSLPLLLVGGANKPSESLLKHYESSDYKNDIYFLPNVDDFFLLKAYQGACLLLYPSLFEGYGWPVGEALACGCLVITTNEAPMNEIGATAALYISRCPNEESLTWAKASAKIVEHTLLLSTKDKDKRIKEGLDSMIRFNEVSILNQIEFIYEKIIYQHALAEV
ncbi:glycosyltransferase [Zobellia amurskyensis]|uniref:Glycosyltransferase n=1 Tax=Zobellia amurskyensis TaxID=248905 RepID=A0A7X2ZSJ8_9FLAO|nr:glycosyltransferase [Zobellia amurskyensis]MUH35597.1 glycosyltransferase [Zobellia amurskyensis]